MTAALELIDLGAHRGDHPLFLGLQVGVDAGRLLRVRGANGSGKTSLLRLLCGLLAPSRGEVRWHGRRITDNLADYHRQLVQIGHAAGVKDELTGAENVLTACRLAGQAVHARDAAHALAQAGLAGREHVPVRLLSQGQRRRVALARLVLSTAVPLWVLDEPFTALDVAATAWLSDLVERQLDRGGIVVLTSHHDVPLADAERQIVLSL